MVLVDLSYVRRRNFFRLNEIETFVVSNFFVTYIDSLKQKGQLKR